VRFEHQVTDGEIYFDISLIECGGPGYDKSGCAGTERGATVSAQVPSCDGITCPAASNCVGQVKWADGDNAREQCSDGSTDVNITLDAGI
jgi:hypothetical protein